MTITMQRQATELTHMCPHPNDVDRKRIQRALETRKRYRYVNPQVLPTVNGYHIVSPCCSRNIDTEGGVIDIGLLQYVPLCGTWSLYRMDHGASKWVLHAEEIRLSELLPQIIEDPQRVFWP